MPSDYWTLQKRLKKIRRKGRREIAIMELEMYQIPFDLSKDNNHVFVKDIKYCLSTGTWTKSDNQTTEGTVSEFLHYLEEFL